MVILSLQSTQASMVVTLVRKQNLPFGLSTFAVLSLARIRSEIRKMIMGAEFFLVPVQLCRLSRVPRATRIRVLVDEGPMQGYSVLPHSPV
jgi:hypothetical protein